MKRAEQPPGAPCPAADGASRAGPRTAPAALWRARTCTDLKTALCSLQHSSQAAASPQIRFRISFLNIHVGLPPTFKIAFFSLLLLFCVKLVCIFTPEFSQNYKHPVLQPNPRLRVEDSGRMDGEPSDRQGTTEGRGE